MATSSVPPVLSGSAPRPRERVQSDSSALEAESEAKRRIATAAQAAQNEERSEAATIDHIRDSYQKEYEAETDREASSYEMLKQKGYEQVRELQRQQQTELNRIKREGERQVADSSSFYRNTVYANSTQGEKELRELSRKQQQQSDYENKKNGFEMALARDSQQKRISSLQNENETQYNQLQAATKKQYDQEKANYLATTEKAHGDFEAKYQNTVNRDTQTLQEIEEHSAERIQSIRADTAEKLAAYSSRQSDPFYKLAHPEAQILDEGENYVLTAKIPSHEQAHVSVAVRGSSIVLSGYRRNEETLDMGPGRSVGSASFQSYHESFPISWPVDSRRMTREFSGDQLTVKVPKIMNSIPYQEAPKEPIERSSLSKPHFPENLPYTAPASKKPRGSGTLS